jgi:hypothetical protein
MREKEVRSHTEQWRSRDLITHKTGREVRDGVARANIIERRGEFAVL